MAKGICTKCGKNLGGFFQAQGLACPGCGKLFCQSCVPRGGGLVFKKPICPTCGRQLKA